jgi:hypothetical protein
MCGGMAIPSGTLQWQAIEETYDGRHEAKGGDCRHNRESLLPLLFVVGVVGKAAMST